jgi:hypothetical protein
LAPIALLARQELAGDEGHQAGDALAGVEDLFAFAPDPRMAQDFVDDFAACAGGHRRVGIVPRLVDEQPVPPRSQARMLKKPRRPICRRCRAKLGQIEVMERILRHNSDGCGPVFETPHQPIHSRPCSGRFIVDRRRH